ncbi:dTDP-4-dehydrorhamnose reductase [Vibrio viridaestus]|uniref:dTDP-4-dehydrorhamnose reductase n=1 Tax=Vibrio viridaestus TaxID=2487322 RepID=A0A3N9TCF8_9VIBR|nr:dTDP-4-dehydrorhamnose reductase [Vibrio viridaestus]RQW61720.1 dTDP-4-dehydrorhamnose reductase [Vibrio viridaestus]
MKVLITGSNGQVGHCLVEQALAKEIDVLALDRKTLDISDQELVMSKVMSFRPDIIINAAAYTAVDKAEDEDSLAYAINRDGPKYLAQAAASVDAAILHISTDYVFSGDAGGIYQESDSTEPQGVYGASKLAGEVAVAENCKRHIIMRTAWVFGEHGNNFVKTMLRLGSQRDSLGIVADQFGGPTYAGDIAATLITVAEKIVSGEAVEFGVYHYSGLPHVSWFDFASKIFEVACEKGLLETIPKLSPITTDMYPTPAKRPANSRLSTSKIEEQFKVRASDWLEALNNLDKYCS